VRETLDCLLDSKLHIRSLATCKIDHCLAAKCSLRSIKRIYSHPQALGQCKLYLDGLGVELVNTSSTARGAELAAGDECGAAVCGSVAAGVYGLDIRMTGISNLATNATRFLVLSLESTNKGGGHTLVRFTLDHHKPGALVAVLEVVKKNGINLSKIETRPRGDIAWHYVFFVEMVEGDAEKVEKVVREMGEFCDEIRVLGSYDAEKVVVRERGGFVMKLGC
jgi:prephenate dehydratase